MHPSPQAGDPASVAHGSPQAHCLLTRNLLFDLELLAHADYFVGTTKSGLSPLVEVHSLFFPHTYQVSQNCVGNFSASCRIGCFQCDVFDHIDYGRLLGSEGNLVH